MVFPPTGEISSEVGSSGYILFYLEKVGRWNIWGKRRLEKLNDNMRSRVRK